MEELFVGFFKSIFRFIASVFVEVIIDIVVYYLGFGFLKLVTFGRYPKRGESSQTVCVIAGILVIVAFILVIALTNSSS